jgi:hypothetical protein
MIGDNWATISIPGNKARVQDITKVIHLGIVLLIFEILQPTYNMGAKDTMGEKIKMCPVSPANSRVIRVSRMIAGKDRMAPAIKARIG